jgi:hypothetical protein
MNFNKKKYQIDPENSNSNNKDFKSFVPDPSS